ncbi:MAG: hypothetical protein AAF368_20510, partial [Planctomycetota bacterium]
MPWPAALLRREVGALAAKEDVAARAQLGEGHTTQSTDGTTDFKACFNGDRHLEGVRFIDLTKEKIGTLFHERAEAEHQFLRA